MNDLPVVLECLLCHKDLYLHQVAHKACGQCGVVLAFCFMCGEGNSTYPLLNEALKKHCEPAAPVFASGFGAQVIRAAGFKCAFRGGNVLVWKPGSKQGWTTAIMGGDWMDHGNLGVFPWFSCTIDYGFAKWIEKDCYCSPDLDTGCDFCSGYRTMPK